MRWGFAALALLACGGRTEIAGSSSEDAGAFVRPVVTCHPGDPPVVLADGLLTHWRDEIATDGASVYVSTQAPGTLWRISAVDGARTVLVQMPQSGFSDLTPADDGVYTDVSYFDDAGEELEGQWIRADGLAQRSMHWGVFAPPLLYWRDYDGSTTDETLSVTSMKEGWTQPILHEHVSPPINPVAVTDRYLYVEQPLYDDCTIRRIDRADGSVHWLSNLMTCLTPAIAGPNAVCSDVGCILDEDETLQPGHGTLALDANYAYRSSNHALHRVALRAAQDDVVTTLEPLAVAVSNGCAYVKTAEQLVRVALP